MSVNKERKNIAVFIDGENVPPKLVDWIFFTATRKGCLTFACVYGDEIALKKWQPAIDRYLLDTQENQIGKNAADNAIKWDAWLFFAQCHVKCILFATQDGGYAACARALQEHGCEVHGIGGLQVSEHLVQSCMTYTIIGVLKGYKSHH